MPEVKAEPEKEEKMSEIKEEPTEETEKKESGSETGTGKRRGKAGS